MEILERAYGKINLSLYITGKREDGYHDLYSLMQTIDLYDELRISAIDKGIEITSNINNLPKDKKNTVFMGIELIKSKYNLNRGYRVDILKRIPIGAGLGGPSADAAALIRGINRLENLNLDLKAMQVLGSEIGADVPFLIQGGLAVCTGIGDVISPVNAALPFKILLMKPSMSVSSKWAFTEFDNVDAKRSVCKEKLVHSIESGDYAEIGMELCNDLELPVLPEYPVLQDMKTFLTDMGAEASLMTGSGSCVYGLFKDENTLLECKNEALKKYKDIFIKDTVPLTDKLI